METVVIGGVALFVFIVAVAFFTKRFPVTKYKRPPTGDGPYIPPKSPDPYKDATFANQERQRQEAKQEFSKPKEE